MNNSWPKYYANQLIINNSSGIGVISGWTKKEDVWKSLSIESREKVSVLGQLYSKEGINFIIRNAFLNPSINFLIITGKDISGSINSFKEFLFEDNNSFIHQEIPEEKIKEFKKYFSSNCAFVDEKDLDSLIKEINVKNLSSKWTENSIDFPDHLPTKTKIFPSEKVGFRIEGERVADVWIKVVSNIMKFGFEKMSAYGEKQKELIDLVSIINKDNPDNPFIPSNFYFNKQNLINYYPQMMTDNIFEGIEYTYGSRLRNHKGIDQIVSIIEDLKKENYSRRAIAFTWDVEKDCKNSKSPCLNLVQALVQDNTLFLTAYFRSNDMYRAWPQNAYGLLKIQKEISLKLGMKIGKLVVVSSSAHIYERDFLEAQKLIEENKSSLSFEEDERGNFIIETVDDEIIVKHVDGNGNFLQEFKGKNAKELGNQISEFISDINHAIYLGEELYRAETSIKNRELFIQDQS